MTIDAADHVIVLVTNPESRFGGVVIELPNGSLFNVKFPPESETPIIQLEI